MAQTAVISQLLERIGSELQGSVASPRREAELLVAAYLECDQLYLMTHGDDRVEDIETLMQWSARRKAHEPLEYIIRRVSFYSETFYIASGALIPRPETELLIDEVIHALRRDFDGQIVEVGVGSGIISIILARHFTKARFIAVDISSDALHVARENIKRFDLEARIELRQGSLLECVDEHIDLLVSNPPYIANDAPLEQNLDYEPHEALFGGSVGDEMIKALLDLTCKRKIPLFACEMGYDQKEKVQAHIKNNHNYDIKFYRDYAHFDRGFVFKRR